MSEVLSGEQLSEVSTSSTSPQIGKTISPTVVTGGAFLVLMTYEVNLNVANTSDLVLVEGFVDGTKIGSHSYYAEQTADWSPGCFAGRVMLSAGAPTLQLLFNVNNGARTGKVRNVRIFAWSVAIDGWDARSYVQVAGSASVFAEVAHATVPLAPLGGTYLAFWAASLTSDSTLRRPILEARMYQGAVVIGSMGGAELDVPVVGAYRPVGGWRLFTIGPSDQTLAFTLHLAPSSNGGALARDVSLVIIRVDGNPDFTVEATQEVLGDQATSSGSLAAVASGTFTAVATQYLFLGATSLRSSSTAGDAQYAFKHAGTTKQGTGQLETGHVSQRYAFFALAYEAYTAGSVTDELQVARSGSSGSVIARDARVATLKLGILANATQAVTLQESLEAAFGKVIDPQTMTLSDAVDLLRALDAAATTQAITLGDLVTFLSQRDVTDVSTLVDGVLALLLPVSQVRDQYAPVQLVEILLATGTVYYATRDIYVSHPTDLWPPFTFFKGNQLTLLEPAEYSVDSLLGFQQTEAIEVAFDNAEGEFTDLRRTEVRNRFFRIWEWDEITNELARLFVGVIAARPSIGVQATFQATMQSQALFVRDFPFRTITSDEFPRADPEALGQPITQVWGSCRKVPMRLIDAHPSENPPPAGTWTYLLYDKIPTAPEFGWTTDFTLPTVTAIYRNGRLVPPTEYTIRINDGPYHDMYVTAEFTRDQGDRTLCFDTVQLNPAFRRNAIILQALLAAYGHEAVDATSFATAAAAITAAYAAAGDEPFFDVSIAEITKFVDIVNELLFRLRLGRADDGRWTATADVLAQRAALRIGMGDGELVNADIGPLEGAAVTDMPAVFELLYAWNRGFLDDGERYVFRRTIPGAPIPNGETRQIPCRFIREHFTAEAVGQFRAQEWVTSDEQCNAVMDREGRFIRRGDVLLVSVPLRTHQIFNEPFRVLSASLGMALRRFRLARYGGEIYAFGRHASEDPVDPAEPPSVTTPDLTFTPPPALTSLEVVSWQGQRASGAGGDGRITAAAILRAKLPTTPVNGTSVIFKYETTTEPRIAHAGDDRPVVAISWGDPAGIIGTVGGLTPGVKFDLYAYIHNSKNERGSSAEENAQDGPLTVLENLMAPVGLLPPIDVAGWQVLAAPGLGAISLTAVPPAANVQYPEVAAVRFYRRADTQPPSESDFLAQVSRFYVDQGTGTDPELAWYYWLKLVDQNGGLTDAFSAISAAAHVRQITPYEMGPGSIHVREQGSHLADFIAIATGSWVDLGSLNIQIPDQQSLTADLLVELLVRVQLTGSVSSTDKLEAQLIDQAGEVLHGPTTLVTGYAAATGVLIAPVTAAAAIDGATTVTLQVKATGGATFTAGETEMILTATYQGSGGMHPR